MRLGNCLHKRQPQAVSSRMFALNKPLKRTALQFRGESGTIVFDDQLGILVTCAQQNFDPATLGQVCQLVVQ